MPRLVRPSSLRYLDPRRHWTELAGCLRDRELQRILLSDFNKFTVGRWSIPFLPVHVPADFVDIDCPRARGPSRHAYHDYVRAGACHWLVNFNVRLAAIAMPSGAWRIITSGDHSTVWDGDRTIFDLNYFALGIGAADCFQRAGCRELKQGTYLKTYLAPDYKTVKSP
jgi:hypothetical protein